MAEYTLNKNENFVNPYNFIPLVGEPKREEPEVIKSENKGELLTGYLSCELITKTPLAIPDAASKQPDDTEKFDGDGKHYIYPFYSVDNEIQIPGSAIRGPLRATYEAATNSCMATIDPEDTITTRTASTDAFHPALLIRNENGEWELLETDRIKVSGFTVIDDKKNKVRYIEDSNGEKVCYGEKVSFVKRENSVSQFYKNPPGGGTFEEGFLFVGEEFSTKKAESIFVKKGGKVTQISNAQMVSLDHAVESYRDEKKNRLYGTEHLGYGGYEKAKEKGILPIWYLRKYGKLYLSVASIGRYSFDRNMGMLTKEFSPCKNRDKSCPACRLFGMVPVGKQKTDLGMGSRIRITDAKPMKDYKNNLGMVTLKELASPHPSYLPFYSTAGKEYDKVVVHTQSVEANVPRAEVKIKGKKRTTNGLSGLARLMGMEDQVSASEPKEVLLEGIRGRKFYWHNPAVNDENGSSVYTTDEKTERNSTCEILSGENHFEFKIYFDEITEDELETLKWVVTLGENEAESIHMHKIGHGKPYGLGSVKLLIRSVTKRHFKGGKYEVSKEESVTVKPDTDISQLHKASVEKLKLITDFNHLQGQTICYPYVSEITESPKTVRETVKEQKKRGYDLKPNVMANHKTYEKYKILNTKEAGIVLPEIEKANSELLHPYKIESVTEPKGKNTGDFKR